VFRAATKSSTVSRTLFFIRCDVCIVWIQGPGSIVNYQTSTSATWPVWGVCRRHISTRKSPLVKILSILLHLSHSLSIKSAPNPERHIHNITHNANLYTGFSCAHHITYQRYPHHHTGTLFSISTPSSHHQPHHHQTDGLFIILPTFSSY
jgi:hypothetical protein